MAPHDGVKKPATYFEIKCKDCGWEGCWDQLKPIKHDGRKVPACPKCTGIAFNEQQDMFEGDKDDG